MYLELSVSSFMHSQSSLTSLNMNKVVQCADFIILFLSFLVGEISANLPSFAARVESSVSNRGGTNPLAQRDVDSKDGKTVVVGS